MAAADRSDEEDDDRPGRRRAEPRFRDTDRPPVLFLVGLGVGLVALLVCSGAGGWGLYRLLVGGGGGSGWGNEVEITAATRGPAVFGGNVGPQISWAAVVKVNGATDLPQYRLVLSGGGVTVVEPFPMTPFKDTNLSQSIPRPQFRGVTSPIDVWVEKRADPNQPGKRVSNVMVAR